MNFNIRDYRESDYQALCELWLATDVGRPDRGDDNETIMRSVGLGGKMLVMEDEKGLLIGTSWMTFDGRRIHLHHFAILPSHQGRGLSKPLLRESLRFVKEKGYQVKLEVHQSNLKAINLYKKAGFKYLGDYDVYIIRDVEGMES
ncbi:MAG: GNAT family N-acetyltransferase [Bacteroidales bacterium]